MQDSENLLFSEQERIPIWRKLYHIASNKGTQQKEMASNDLYLFARFTSEYNKIQVLVSHKT